MGSSVSILLLMKNEMANLKKSWDILAGQEYDGPVEYVYVDSGSTDGTLEFMKERGVEAHAIKPTDFHHGRTRNLAASLARHEVLVFLSGDAIPLDTHWLDNLVSPFEDIRVGATYGRQVAPAHIGPIRQFGMAWEYPMTPQVRDLSDGKRPDLSMFRMSNANSAVRASMWKKFRFNEKVVTSEDVGLCRDILLSGMKVVYVPEAAVYHCHEKSLWYEFQKAFDSGISLQRLGILSNPAYGSESRYGIRRVREELRHFTSQGMYGMALKSLITSASKWAGVQLGKRGDRIPRWLSTRISAGIEKMYD